MGRGASPLAGHGLHSIHRNHAELLSPGRPPSQDRSAKKWAAKAMPPTAGSNSNKVLFSDAYYMNKVRLKEDALLKPKSREANDTKSRGPMHKLEKEGGVNRGKDARSANEIPQKDLLKKMSRQSLQVYRDDIVRQIRDLRRANDQKLDRLIR